LLLIAVNNRLDRWVLALIAILLVTTVLQSISYASAIEKIESQNSFDFEDPTPGRYETSEYMIGSVAVGVIFPESNGAIDESTEDWTEAEELQITSKINDALDWWASQNPDANVSFVTEFNYRVPTSYELITHNFSDPVLVHAYDVVCRFKGVGRYAEDPLRSTEVGFHIAQGLNLSIKPAIEIPPTRAVRNEVQNSRSRPFWL